MISLLSDNCVFYLPPEMVSALFSRPAGQWPVGHQRVWCYWLHREQTYPDALVGGHIGLEMEFRVLDEQGVETGTNWWRKFTGKLLFWQEKKTQ